MKPAIPSHRDLTRRLRELHEAFAHPIAGGEYVSLVYAGRDHWSAEVVGLVDSRFRAGREWIPGDGRPFDASAAARRLLSDLRSHLRGA